MKIPNWKQQFFASTRGRIVEILRYGSRTVSELAEELQLTENAVRAHLSTLERDGLIKRSGERRGARRPFATYDLTLDADQLFPKACDPIFIQILNVLADQCPPKQVDQILREVGHRVAADHRTVIQEDAPEEPIEKALALFRNLGGLARIEEQGGHLFIRGYACPLSFASVKHPEVCKMMESLLADMIGSSVYEHCQREEPPRCLFEISINETGAGRSSNPR